MKNNGLFKNLGFVQGNVPCFFARAFDLAKTFIVKIFKVTHSVNHDKLRV